MDAVLPQIANFPPSSLESEHTHEPLSSGEAARIWQPKGLSDIELLHGTYRTFAFARHFHDSVSIGIVESGSMRTYCRGRVHDVPAGQVILLNPGDVHAPQPATEGGWSFRMFYLDPGLVQELTAEDKGLEFAKPFVENPDVYASLLQIHRTFEHDPDRLQAESMLVSGLASIREYSPATKAATLRSAGSLKIERAREYLYANCMESVSIGELAAVAEISPYHLVRSFRAQVGLTPHAFLLQARIEGSRKLLSSGASIAETALHAGFVDQSHFTRLFKRFTGVTPAKYLFDGARGTRC